MRKLVDMLLGTVKADWNYTKQSLKADTLTKDIMEDIWNHLPKGVKQYFR